MGNLRELTSEQKISVSAYGYLPDSWMLEKQTEFYLKIVHKVTGTRRTVDRYAIPKKGGKKHEVRDLQKKQER